MLLKKLQKCEIPAPDYWRWLKSSKTFSVAKFYLKGKVNMENVIIRAVKLTGISICPEQKPEIEHIPVVSLKQMSDDRWNELARMNRKERELLWLN